MFFVTSSLEPKATTRADSKTSWKKTEFILRHMHAVELVLTHPPDDP
jgi:hypothetical protein